ncbi:hypothetical protein [Lederbergia graminis]|uniref:NADH dehydrogenase subunit 6 n=1 Tax=Lederbergia graminis TaxID=735518 RepID=A0ABW0LIZ6_9BACI
MELVIFINLTLLVMIAFFLQSKRLHILENIFLYMMLVFFLTGYMGILYVNVGSWKVSSSIDLFIIFRLYEFIMSPLLYLAFFNLFEKMDTKMKKFIVFIAFVAIISSAQFLLVKWEVITFMDWHIILSSITIVMMILVMYVALLLFRKVLRREGIRE